MGNVDLSSPRMHRGWEACHKVYYHGDLTGYHKPVHLTWDVFPVDDDFWDVTEKGEVTTDRDSEIHPHLPMNSSEENLIQPSFDWLV